MTIFYRILNDCFVLDEMSVELGNLLFIQVECESGLHDILYSADCIFSVLLTLWSVEGELLQCFQVLP